MNELNLRRDDFYYYLPEELIAQVPLEKRDESRLLVMNREEKKIEHKHFYDIVDYVDKNDCLVLNNTKVIPARIFGKKISGANIEILLLKRLNNKTWECLIKPGKRVKAGTKIVFSQELTCIVTNELNDGVKTAEFEFEGSFENILEKLGKLPLPPYIKNDISDEGRYQTIYARKDGSAAAPTAGLHFTEDLLMKLKNKGVNIAYITLHVGLGTFRPVKSEYIKDHEMHFELYELDKKNCDIINNSKNKGGKIISVGTTSTRALESIMNKHGLIIETSGWTDIFISPGYSFKSVDMLITNFHLPESTLIMLVASFAGYDFTMKAYKDAVNERYRFFSFGDAMLIT